MKKIRIYTIDMPGHITPQDFPKCFPSGAKLPAEHHPTLWYTVDAWVTPTAEESHTQTDRMRGVKAIYTRGEGFTVKTEAERANYLLLAWFLKKNAQGLFTKANAIMMEFASAGTMPIIRIVEAMQQRPECGWAVYCKESGSCWADTLLGPEDECLDEKIVVKKLKAYANGAEDTTFWILYFSICIAGIVCLCLLSYITKLILKLFHGNAKPAAAIVLEHQEAEAEAAAKLAEQIKFAEDKLAEEEEAEAEGLRQKAAEKAAEAAEAKRLKPVAAAAPRASSVEQ